MYLCEYLLVDSRSRWRGFYSSILEARMVPEHTTGNQAGVCRGTRGHDALDQIKRRADKELS